MVLKPIVVTFMNSTKSPLFSRFVKTGWRVLEMASVMVQIEWEGLQNQFLSVPHQNRGHCTQCAVMVQWNAAGIEACIMI